MRWKFRFEKLGREPGWWSLPSPIPQDYPLISSIQCTKCNKSFPIMYEEGWMCLNDTCRSFWKINNKRPPHLTYLPAFISPSTPPQSSTFHTAPHSLRPPLVADKDIFYNGNDVAKIFWKGFCCPLCGRLNCRELFSHWTCFTPNCPFTHGAPHRTVYTARQLADPDRMMYTGVPLVSDWVKTESGIKLWQDVIRVLPGDGGEGGPVRSAVYEFGNIGRIIHLVPSVGANGGADEMFHKYQTQGIPFRRYRIMNGKGTPSSRLI